tara:strand:+ start:1168 stop:1770 length:603 start_codon:yes stop_codon:yes gene_type:complete
MAINGSRGLPAAVVTEIAKDSIKYIDLIELHFDSADGGIVFLTNGQFAFPVSTTTSGGSQTFVANGEFLSFELIDETESAKVNEINIVLSGCSTTFTNLFLNNDYIERRIVIYRQFLDSANVAISTPIMMFDGEMKNFTVDDKEDTSTVVIKSASVFYNFDDNNGRRTTEASQQRHFPSDRGLQFASTTTQDIRWGRPDA